jgi:hypothetical protein
VYFMRTWYRLAIFYFYEILQLIKCKMSQLILFYLFEYFCEFIGLCISLVLNTDWLLFYFYEILQLI